MNFSTSSSSDREERLEAKRYLTWFGAMSGLLLVASAAFVLGVDPFGLATPLALDALRPFESERGSRTFKASRVARGGNDVLLLGSSRTLWGLDPEHAYLGESRGFNAALPGTTLFETVRMYRLGRGDPSLSKVLLVVHLGVFHGGETSGGDFEKSLLNESLGRIDYAMEKIWSIRALEAAMDTVENFRSGEVSSHTELGFRVAGQKDTGYSPRALFEAVLAGYLLRDYRFGDYQYGAEQLRRFRMIASMAQEDEIELVVAIAPVHVTLLEVIRETGQWPVFEMWKGDLVESLRGTGFALYDFTSYAGYASEPVPLDGEPGDSMRWWLECSHFNRDLGDLMLGRILGDAPIDPAAADFGVRLTTDNLDVQLSRIEREREAWAASNPDQIRWLRGVIERARAGEIETL